MKGFKGFNNDLTCKGYQYEIGGEYQHEGNVSICERGFHFCENPLDTLCFYPPGQSRYAEVEGDGETERDWDRSKVVCSHLWIATELDLRNLIQAGVQFVMDKAKGDRAHAATTGDEVHAVTAGYGAHAVTTGCGAHAVTKGDRAHAVTAGNDAHAATTGYRTYAVTTGYEAHAVTTGYGAHAVTTGYGAHAVTTGGRAHAVTAGRESIAAGLGVNNRAKGALGCWLVLAEGEWTETGYHILTVQAVKVDGGTIKPDTWYELKGGKFTECSER
jgi:hypothetical protein